MAKSDFTSTHVSEEANHMESPAATPDESHNTVSVSLRHKKHHIMQ